MTKQLQSDLSELDELKGIRIVMTDRGLILVLGFSHQRKTPGENALVWIFWTAVGFLYGAFALMIWWLVK
jgi:hypothetical protein